MPPLRRYSLTTTSGTRRRTSWMRATCAPASRWPSRQAPPARKASAADLTAQGPCVRAQRHCLERTGDKGSRSTQRSLQPAAVGTCQLHGSHCHYACAGCTRVCAQTAPAPVVENGGHAPHHQQPAACFVQSVDAMSCIWTTLRGRTVLLVLHACTPAAPLSASWLAWPAVAGVPVLWFGQACCDVFPGSGCEADQCSTPAARTRRTSLARACGEGMTRALMPRAQDLADQPRCACGVGYD